MGKQLINDYLKNKGLKLNENQLSRLYQLFRHYESSEFNLGRWDIDVSPSGLPKLIVTIEFS